MQTIDKCVVSGLLMNLVNTRTIFHAQTAASTEANNENLWDAYLSNFYTEVRPLLAGTFQTVSYELFHQVQNGWVPYYTWSIDFSGTASGDQLPNQNAAVLISKINGRGAVGKKFMSGLAESMVTGNSLTSAALIVAAEALVAYILPFPGIGEDLLTPGIVDKGGVFRAFVGGVVSSFIGSQRRRKPGNGM
jgi:hypothetical protein